MHLYGQYCPVARAAEILADRWTLLIVRELLADVDHFNELERGLPGISRSLLAERLRLLVSTGVAERRAAKPGRRVEYRGGSQQGFKWCPIQFSSGRLSSILDRNVAPRSVASAIPG